MKPAICYTAMVQGVVARFAKNSPAGIDQAHPALQRWYAAIHETQNDREVVTLYAHLVQPVLDAQARREISRSAAESALMIAVSPLAMVDMAFIATAQSAPDQPHRHAVWH